MVEKKQHLPYFTRWNPIARFEQVPETIIHNTYLSSDLDRDSIKILSWNVAKNNYDPIWSRDFIAIIEQYQPDKIFLQEVCLRASVKEIPELAQMNWAFAPNFIDRFNNTYSGVSIATKGDRLDSKAMTTRHYEPVINTPKVSLFTEHSLGKHSESLLATNTHLINFVSMSKFKIQLHEIESVLAKHKGAIILAGDFNTWNKSRWQMLCQMVDRLNLTSVSFTPEDAKKIKNFLFSPPLDYIFYRGFIPKLHTAKVIDNISSSDHNPLFVELCLNNT